MRAMLSPAKATRNIGSATVCRATGVIGELAPAGAGPLPGNGPFEARRSGAHRPALYGVAGRSRHRVLIDAVAAAERR